MSNFFRNNGSIVKENKQDRNIKWVYFTYSETNFRTVTSDRELLKRLCSYKMRWMDCITKEKTNVAEKDNLLKTVTFLRHSKSDPY
jgi:hypothetical protein